LEEYRNNIRAILVHNSISKHRPKILLVTPPIINEVHLESEDLKKGYLALSRHQKVTAQYAKVVREVAAEFNDQNVVLVDLWTALMNEAIRLTPEYVEDGRLLGSREKGDSQGLRSLLVDGLHLTGQGYKVFLREVLPHVGVSWSQEAFNSPSWVFP
jgi:lysophospholipase L1-like esterase